jgi:hypothetical protein
MEIRIGGRGEWAAWTALAATSVLLGFPPEARAAAPAFTRQTINTEFYSEGINVADLNLDGILDIIAGPYWYPGPTYAPKTAFRTPRSTPYPTSGDSDCYGIFIHDFNADGWPDILSFRQDGGAQALWYENPKGVAGNWTERVAFSSVHNESPAFVDVDADGKPELVTNSARYGGWASPNWNAPNNAWTFKSVTQQAPTSWNWNQFTHGAGAGDVNGDGRIDLLFPQGWWEQPASAASVPWVQHAVSFWGQALASEGLGGAQMQVYDVDGDGDNDVITSMQAHGWGLAWFENQGGSGGNFAQRMIINTRADTALYGGVAFPQLHALALADIDGDGLKDIITGKRRGAHGNGLSTTELNAAAVLYAFRLVRTQGMAPRYEAYRLDTLAGVGTQVTVTDVNGDGAPDILTAARQGAFLFLNQNPVALRPQIPRRLGSVPSSAVVLQRDALGRRRVLEGMIPYLAIPGR